MDSNPLDTSALRGLVLKSRRCRIDILAVADGLKAVSSEDIEGVIRQLLDEGRDGPLRVLLRATAVRGIKVNPVLLVEAAGIAADILDLAPCFGVQDANVMDPLLTLMASEELDKLRRMLVARIAAELCVKFGANPKPVEAVFKRLIRENPPPALRLFFDDTLALLRGEPRAENPAPVWTAAPPLEYVPEEKPPLVIGGDYTVRRPVAKLGRNDPCRCGSGKKYKKCCYEADQDRLRDASSYEGVTVSELRAFPGRVRDPAAIDHLRPHELRKVKPEVLATPQLFPAFRKSIGLGLYDAAFSLLQELERRPDRGEFDPGHYADLLDFALEAGDMEVVRKIRGAVAEDVLDLDDATRLFFDLREHPERLEALEKFCRGVLDDPEKAQLALDHPLIALAFAFETLSPALSIVFAYAAILLTPGRTIDHYGLMDVIQSARISIGLEPHDEAIENICELLEQQSGLVEAREDGREEVDALRRKLEEAGEASLAKRRELAEKEATIRSLTGRLERTRRESAGEAGVPQAAEPTVDERATTERLRQQVSNLKAEIRSQQEIRADLRRQLQEEQVVRVERDRDARDGEDVAGTEENLRPPAAGGTRGRLVPPEFTDAFRRSAEALPPDLVGRAMMAAARFASFDAAIWRQARRLEGLPDYYRVRVGLRHRLMLRFKPGECLSVLDLIARAQLETWIQRHSKASE